MSCGTSSKAPHSIHKAWSWWRVQAHAPSASVNRMNTGEVVELFDGGWLLLDEGLPPIRVIVARHPAPPPGKSVTVGKRVDEWVYELFITTLDADGFLV